MTTPSKEPEARHLVLIDDDELTREVLTLMTTDAGFATSAFESGDAALAHIAGLDCKSRPEVIVTDMQMPGLAGGALASQLRTLCGGATVILAMSGSKVAEEKLADYDGFLLKPFSADDLIAASSRRAPAASAAEDSDTPHPVALNESVYNNFAARMPPVQVAGLYKMCLEDASRRITMMRTAVEAGDETAYRKAAHAIKGGCGMVGAVELAAMASQMETEGPPAAGAGTTLDSFQAASSRLERMLEERWGAA